ncbi:MAG TPA: MFS transporter [Candidatus Alistipes intestinigallinarum]|uniref:MFS transporter n=1 Tax=Candidatus Alistipes intestinigallinarum TaxID=2838440 RepID=A0A9D1Z1M5_9BACT|nr:MFS transporter [Candidatus Alistipes intestinigallinarum]
MTTACDGRKKRSNYKWEVLALLWVAYLLNQADRQVFNVVLPLIREDLGLSDVAIGSIATIFNLFYAVLVPIGGLVGDRFSRKWIVTGSILFWSVATMFTGLCNGFLMLVLMRSIATGGGEAFFGPANYSLLAQYHDRTRAFAMSVHQTAYYIGIIISGYAAGYIGQQWGWRSAFYVFGAIGVIHGIVMAVRLKDKREEPSKAAAADPSAPKPKLLEGFRMVFTTPTALILTVCFAGLIFVLTGYLTWMPTYLFERFDMDLSGAGFHSMFYTHLFAFFGVLLAGRLSDKLGRLHPAWRMAMQGFGLLAAVPFILLMGNSATLWVIYVGFAGFGFARAFFDANTYTVLYDVIPPRYHSSASSLMMMVGFGIGALAPVVLGAVKQAAGLSFGISMLAVVWLVCGAVMVLGAKLFYLKDYNKIEHEQ